MSGRVSELAAEEFVSAIRRTRVQAEEVRDRLRVHDESIVAARAWLEETWEGGSEDSVILKAMEEMHQSVRAFYLKQSQELDAEADALEGVAMARG